MRTFRKTKQTGTWSTSMNRKHSMLPRCQFSPAWSIPNPNQNHSQLLCGYQQTDSKVIQRSQRPKRITQSKGFTTCTSTVAGQCGVGVTHRLRQQDPHQYGQLISDKGTRGTMQQRQSFHSMEQLDVHM